jgi:hypothetical protein
MSTTGERELQDSDGQGTRRQDAERLAESLALNHRLLASVARDTPMNGPSRDEDETSGSCSPVVIHDLALAKFCEEVLVVRNDDELEVAIPLTRVDDSEKVGNIESGSGLEKGS